MVVIVVWSGFLCIVWWLLCSVVVVLGVVMVVIGCMCVICVDGVGWRVVVVFCLVNW